MRKKRKLGICGGLFLSSLILLSGSAFATSVSEDYSSSTVTISGDAEAKQLVSIQILQEGKSLEELAASSDPGSLVIYTNQTKADENGKFSFDFTYDGKSGTYNAYIASKLWNEPQIVEVNFVNSQEYEKVIDSLNNAASKDDFIKTVKDNLIVFNDGLNIDNINLDSAMGKMYDYTRKEKLDVKNSSRTQKIFDTFTVIEGINEKKVGNAIQYMGSVLVPQDIEEWLSKVKNDSKQSGAFNSQMASRTFDSAEEFQKGIKESVILAVVEFPGGAPTAKKIMQEYAEFIGLDSGKPDDRYTTVSGKHYNSVSALASAFNGSGSGPGNGGGNGGGNGSGGGRGGSKGSSGGISVAPGYGSNTQKPENVKRIFSDIDSVAWANEAICALADKGIINGKSETEFCPDDFVTREEFTKMIIGVMGIPTDGKENVFSDVDDNAWYAPFVKTAYEKNIIKGIGDGKFGTGSNITRQDMAVIAANVSGLKGKPEKSFIDESEISDYALDAVNALAAAGMINGDENYAFNPNNNSTRAEAAKIVYELYKYMN